MGLSQAVPVATRAGQILRQDPRTGDPMVTLPRRQEPEVLERVESAIESWCEAIRLTEDWSTTSDLIKSLMALCDVRNELKLR